MSGAFVSATSTSNERNSFDATAKKIVSFGKLAVGWWYGRGIPASGRSILAALDFLSYFTQLGLLTTDAFPGSDGEIAIAAYRGDFFLRVGIEANGMTDVCLQDGEREVLAKQEVAMLEAYSVIASCVEIVEKRCVTYDSFTQDHMMLGAENSITTPSNETATTAAFLLFNETVSSKSGMKSVNTSEGIIKEFPGSHRFSGNLMGMPLNFRQMVGA